MKRCVYALKKSSSYFKWFSSFKINKRIEKLERGITPLMLYGIQSKVSQVILSLIFNNILNFRSLGLRGQFRMGSGRKKSTSDRRLKIAWLL